MGGLSPHYLGIRKLDTKRLAQKNSKPKENRTNLLLICSIFRFYTHVLVLSQPPTVFLLDG